VKIGDLLHQPLNLLRVLAFTGSHPYLEIHSRTEGVSFSSQDGTVEVVVFIEPAPGLVHADQHGRAQGVLRLRSIQGNDQGMPFPFNRAVLRRDIELLGHGILPDFGGMFENR